MREWDRRATDNTGVPERVLMEAAGRALATLVQRLYPAGRIVAAVGPGNNGGDALIALRSLAAWGREVAAVPVRADVVRAELLHGWELTRFDAANAAEAFAGAGVLLDGLLGTGAQGKPRPPFAKMIRAINACGAPVVAVDGPAGVDFTTGATPGEAVRAAITVAFGAPKRGLLRFPGREHAGRIIVAEVGFPPLPADLATARIVTPAWARARLPRIPADAHKGTTGTVAIVAGGAGMAGAAIMAATAAARAGAGLVRVFSDEVNRLALHTALPEAVFTGWGDEPCPPALGGADGVVCGPGLGTAERAAEVLHDVLATGSAPLLLDADALNLLAQNPSIRDQAGERPLLLTPHPGEMARLLGCDTEDVTADPFAAADAAAERFRCAVLLKGAPSVVAARGEAVLVNVTGHSGIATGGTGDTLAGVAGALLAQGAGPQAAGALALFYSGRAAEIAGRGRGLLPRDVAEALPAAFAADVTPSPLQMLGITLDLAAAG